MKSIEKTLRGTLLLLKALPPAHTRVGDSCMCSSSCGSHSWLHGMGGEGEHRLGARSDVRDRSCMDLLLSPGIVSSSSFLLPGPARHTGLFLFPPNATQSPLSSHQDPCGSKPCSEEGAGPAGTAEAGVMPCTLRPYRNSEMWEQTHIILTVQIRGQKWT